MRAAPETEIKDKNNMKKERPSLSSREYIVPFVLITSLFFMWGFARAILDVLNKHFQTELDISITQSALIQVTTYLGYFLMAIPAGLFINRLGYRRGVVFGLVLFGLGSLAFIPCAAAGTFYAYLVALFIIGCGLVFLETSANPYVTELGPKTTATARLNFSQSFNGVGSMFATLVVGSFLFQSSGEGGSAVVPYSIMGVVVLIIAVVFSRVNLPEIVHSDDSETQHGRHNLSRLFGNKWFVFGLSALLAYEVAEISINSYFINFVTGEDWMEPATASTILTVALGLFMLSRFVGAAIMSAVSAEKYLLVCAVGTVVCIAVLLLNLGRDISVAALMCNYFFEAIMFPTIFSLTLRGLGGLTKSASSILMMTPVGGCGFLLMGLVADHTGNFVLPFFIPLVGFAVVLAYALRCVTRQGESKEA